MPTRPRTPSSYFEVPKIRNPHGSADSERESNVLPGEGAADLAFRAELKAAGAGELADRLVRAIVRAKTAPRLRMPTDVVAPYLETMTFSDEEGARRFFDALSAFWDAIDREAPRPTAETPREQAEDLLEMAISEEDRGDDLKKVRRMLRKAAEADPGWWEPHLELADLEFHAFDNEEQARIHYGRALETSRAERPHAPDPDKEPEAWTWSAPAARPYLRCLEALADYHAEKGEWDKARRAFERLLRHDPSDPLKAAIRLAEAHERTGEPVPALEAYRKIVADSGASEPGALYSLGRLEAATGHRKEAHRTLWRAALAQPWAAAALLDVPFEGELDPEEFPEIEWIEIGLGYAERCDDLWRSEPKAAALLSAIWKDPRFADERSRAIQLSAEMMSENEDEEPSPEARGKLHSLLDPARIAKLLG